MKKSLVAALTGALVVGATATTFAAANPFSDVPAGHWAYNSVVKLASEGIIEGYGDGTFRGNRNITRYEMAQMIARALARYDNTGNPTPAAPVNTRPINAATRAELDKLAAEFRDELDSLGVRVAELEKHADMVKWNGKIEYTYGHLKNEPKNGPEETGMGHDAVFRLEPSAYVNSHWTANARFDANVDFRNDSTADVKLKRIFAQGDYGKFGLKVGRIGFCPAIEDGLVFDNVVTGAELSFGSKWKGIVTVGRAYGGDEPEYTRMKDYNSRSYARNHTSLPAGESSDPTDVIALNIQYNPGDTGLYGGASYYYAKDDDFKYYTKAGQFGNEDKANIWAVALGYKFSDMLDLHGSYANNSKADYQDYGWAADLRFGRYGDYANQGDWAVWGGYARFGDGVGIGSNQGDDVQTGAKGWHVGAAYAPFKNVGLLARYSDGKWIDNGDKYKKIFGRVELFF